MNKPLVAPSWNLLADRVEVAVRALFGTSTLGARILAEVNRLREDCERISTNRGLTIATIALIGAKSQGKTWLARCLVRREQLYPLMPTGDLGEEGTTKLTWIGPVPPLERNPDVEEFLQCSQKDMADLGMPYVLLDSPGFTDADTRSAQTARESVTSAQMKILVVRRDRIRDASHVAGAALADGSVLLPVVTAIRPDDENLAADVAKLRDEIAKVAPRAHVLDPVYVEDFELSENETETVERAVESLRVGVRQAAHRLVSPERLAEKQIDARVEQFRARLGDMLRKLTPALHAAVQDLETEADRLPVQLVASMLGSQSVLSAGIRSRMRAELMASTSPIWFPYRTISGLLNLTQGAWDKLILTFTGSVPSLFGSLFNVVRNVRDSKAFSEEMQAGVRRRLTAMVRDRLAPLMTVFHNTVRRLTDNDSSNSEDVADARLAGIEELQSASTEIFEKEVAERSSPRIVVELAAAAGTAIFWGIFSGPIVALYREYYGAAQDAFASQRVDLSKFPSSHGSMLLTSLILALLPVLIYSMLFLTLALRRGKITACANEIRRSHLEKIEEMKRDGVLRLQFDHSELEHAQFLLRHVESTRPDSVTT